jgi:segregation and condensation protein B
MNETDIEASIAPATDTADADANAVAITEASTESDSAQADAITVSELSLAAHVEALLYASKEPASINAIATTLDATTREVEDALEQLTEQYQWRGIRLQRQGNKLQLVTAPEVAPKVQKFLGLEEVNKLSSAAMETLAIIAYNQPVTKPQLEMIRGVNCDGVMNTLEARNLIVELGRADTVGHPMRYGVSFEFLQYFGLRSTHELPPVTNLETLPSPEPEKQGVPVAVPASPALPFAAAVASNAASEKPIGDEPVIDADLEAVDATVEATDTQDALNTNAHDDDEVEEGANDEDEDDDDEYDDEEEDDDDDDEDEDDEDGEDEDEDDD